MFQRLFRTKKGKGPAEPIVVIGCTQNMYPGVYDILGFAAVVVAPEPAASASTTKGQSPKNRSKSITGLNIRDNIRKSLGLPLLDDAAPAEPSKPFFSGNWKMPSLLGTKRPLNPVAVIGCTQNMYPAVYDILGYVEVPEDKITKKPTKSLFSGNWKLPTLSAAKKTDPGSVVSIAGCTEGMYPAVFETLGYKAGEPRLIEFPVGSKNPVKSGFFTSFFERSASKTSKPVLARAVPVEENTAAETGGADKAADAAASEPAPAETPVEDGQTPLQDGEKNTEDGETGAAADAEEVGRDSETSLM
jgi:hypothetical protein